MELFVSTQNQCKTQVGMQTGMSTCTKMADDAGA